MMPKQKITDEQVNRHLNEGMSQRAIADLYDMQPSTLSARIKKMREKGTLKVEKANLPFPELGVKRMDTVVRLSDRYWFRVMEINGDQVTLKGTLKGEFKSNSETITVSMDELTREFEKKDYPEVKCYVDPDLKKGSGEMIQVKSDNQEREVTAKEESINFKAVGAFTVQREFLSRIDAIMTAVNIPNAADELLEQMNKLIGQMIMDGVQEEIDNSMGQLK